MSQVIEFVPITTIFVMMGMTITIPICLLIEYMFIHFPLMVVYACIQIIKLKLQYDVIQELLYVILWYLSPSKSNFEQHVALCSLWRVWIETLDLSLVGNCGVTEFLTATTSTYSTSQYINGTTLWAYTFLKLYSIHKIQNQPKRFVQIKQSKQQSEFCPICRDEFIDPYMTNCKHYFCYRCINDWIDHNLVSGNITCPLCRCTLDTPSQWKSLPYTIFLYHI
jgi:hypothetical protein